MSKELHCGDLMAGCDFVAKGKDEAEVMTRTAEHARKVHGLTEITPDLAGKVQAAIREKTGQPA